MRKHGRKTEERKTSANAASSYTMDFRRGLIQKRIAMALAEPVPESMKHWLRV